MSDRTVLRNEKIVIFGGGSGIGRAIAVRFIEAGAKVIITGRTEEKLIETAKTINSENLFYKVFDITDIGHHINFFEECEKCIGEVSAFVNAAAIASSVYTGRGYDPWDVTEDEWDFLSDTNYKAAFFIMRNEINYMIQKGIRGNILNIASNGAYKGIFGSYGSAKLSIIKWTRTLGQRYGHKGIIINGIAPGATFTPMIARYAKKIDQHFPLHAIERLIRADEIAELAFYLMSNYGEIICGHTVVADGGDNDAY